MAAFCCSYPILATIPSPSCTEQRMGIVLSWDSIVGMMLNLGFGMSIPLSAAFSSCLPLHSALSLLGMPSLLRHHHLGWWRTSPMLHRTLCVPWMSLISTLGAFSFFLCKGSHARALQVSVHSPYFRIFFKFFRDRPRNNYGVPRVKIIRKFLASWH